MIDLQVLCKSFVRLYDNVCEDLQVYVKRYNVRASDKSWIRDYRCVLFPVMRVAI